MADKQTQSVIAANGNRRDKTAAQGNIPQLSSGPETSVCFSVQGQAAINGLGVAVLLFLDTDELVSPSGVTSGVERRVRQRILASDWDEWVV